MPTLPVRGTAGQRKLRLSGSTDVNKRADLVWSGTKFTYVDEAANTGTLATENYVDQYIQGLNIKRHVQFAANQNFLSSATVQTGDVNGAIPDFSGDNSVALDTSINGFYVRFDGSNDQNEVFDSDVLLGDLAFLSDPSAADMIDRVLIYDGATNKNPSAFDVTNGDKTINIQGIWQVSLVPATGTAGYALRFTLANDFDLIRETRRAFVFVQDGAHSDLGFVQTAILEYENDTAVLNAFNPDNPYAPSTRSLTFNRFGRVGNFTGGNFISVVNGTINLDYNTTQFEFDVSNNLSLTRVIGPLETAEVSSANRLAGFTTFTGIDGVHGYHQTYGVRHGDMTTDNDGYALVNYDGNPDDYGGDAADLGYVAGMGHVLTPSFDIGTMLGAIRQIPLRAVTRTANDDDTFLAYQKMAVVQNQNNTNMYLAAHLDGSGNVAFFWHTPDDDMNGLPVNDVNSVGITYDPAGTITDADELAVALLPKSAPLVLSQYRKNTYFDGSSWHNQQSFYTLLDVTTDDSYEVNNMTTKMTGTVVERATGGVRNFAAPQSDNNFWVAVWQTIANHSLYDEAV